MQPKDKLYNKILGQKIKKIRLEQNLTQFDLAIKSEMEENALQRIESGRTNPTVKTLLKIACALKTQMKELFPDIDASVLE